jgi:mRNA-degrading endonuclease toxin of MazEF toxin-antitoxin module
VVRGDIHAINQPHRRGRVRHGGRVVVCPTSQSVRPASFHPDVAIGDESTRALCEMVGAVDARKLGRHVGHLTRDEMRGIDDALLLVLGLR